MRRIYARARTVRRKPGTMNKTEERYSVVLEARKRAGEILAWWFEPCSYKLAEDMRYTPDFLVQLPTGEMEVHEVKARRKVTEKVNGAKVRTGEYTYLIEEDAKIKIRAFAALFPYPVLVVYEDAGGWVSREFSEFEACE